jgi:hypothetical protein
MYDIESIQAMYLGQAVQLTRHFHDRVKERSIKYADVRSAVMNGEIIEQCLDDVPNPSIIILGQNLEGKPLHVVVGVDDDKLWLITAYYPAPDMWETDCKTRKELN